MMRFPKKFVFLSTALAILGCSSGNNTTQTEPPITPGISWASPAAITYGTALSSVQLDASTDGVAGTFVYSPVAGTILPAGNQTLAVTFTPADTTKYTNAIANATLTVNKATPNITWTPAALIAGSALGSSQLDASAGSVAGSFAYTPAAGTVESTVGSVTLSATFTPTDTANYTTAPASATLTVSKPMPALSWATPAPITYGTALSSTQLDASSGGVAGTFTYTPAAGTVLTAGSQSLSVTFSPTDTVDYSPTTASVTLTVNKAAPTVSWATPAPITYGTALSTTQLNASAGSVAGAFTYTPTAGTVLLAG
jgi:hypothetical protein